MSKYSLPASSPQDVFSHCCSWSCIALLDLYSRTGRVVATVVQSLYVGQTLSSADFLLFGTGSSVYDFPGRTSGVPQAAETRTSTANTKIIKTCILKVYILIFSYCISDLPVFGKQSANLTAISYRYIFIYSYSMFRYILLLLNIISVKNLALWPRFS